MMNSNFSKLIGFKVVFKTLQFNRFLRVVEIRIVSLKDGFDVVISFRPKRVVQDHFLEAFQYR